MSEHAVYNIVLCSGDFLTDMICVTVSNSKQTMIMRLIYRQTILLQETVQLPLTYITSHHLHHITHYMWHISGVDEYLVVCVISTFNLFTHARCIS